MLHYLNLLKSSTHNTPAVSYTILLTYTVIWSIDFQQDYLTDFSHYQNDAKNTVARQSNRVGSLSSSKSWFWIWA